MTTSNGMIGLEMEEVEGLVSVSKSSVGSGAKRKGESSSLINRCAAVAVESQNRKRFLTVAMVGFAMFIIWIALSGGNDETEQVVDIKGQDDESDDASTSIVITTEPPLPAEPQETEPPKATPPPAPPTLPPTPEPIKTDLRIPPLDYTDPFHVPITNDDRDVITNRWGQWHFWDGDEAQRPKQDYCGEHPNRDIPGMQFPSDSWQVDAVYVNHFLNDADKLVSRAMEAIFTEYGHGKPLPPEQMMERMKMFHWERLDMATATGPPANFARRGARDTGGWTTKRSYQGLVRRLLHALMTRDTFTVVLGGHSAAAGAGNHFRQSYMMQFHKIMFPIFARLNVKLITRNISQGGLGTIQAGMASGSIYGDEVDLLIWDSGMTEGPVPQHIDLFLRQGLIGGKRVPVLWGGPFHLLKMLHEECDADIGENGLGTYGVPTTTSEEQAKELPFAVRNFKCAEDRTDLCADRFRATCWIDRPDGIKPQANQYPHLQSQVKWHPGWRAHQLEGRVIAFQVLEALQSAINTWSEATMSGQPLDDSYWHVTEYYDNIRTKVKNLDKTKGNCYDIEGSLPTRMCNTPMKGRTQYTPRANFEESSLTSILKPAEDGYVPKNTKVALYDGPDVHNPNYDIPEGEVDVFAIVMNRRRRLEENNVTLLSEEPGPTKESNFVSRSALRSRKLDDDKIVPGKGWEVFDEPQGVCDGEYLSICGRSTDNPCVLEGKHDARGAVVGSELSGWLVMNLKAVKEGIIVIKLHTWHYENENPRTNGWKGVNNEEKDAKSDENPEEEAEKKENGEDGKEEEQSNEDTKEVEEQGKKADEDTKQEEGKEEQKPEEDENKDETDKDEGEEPKKEDAPKEEVDKDADQKEDSASDNDEKKEDPEEENEDNSEGTNEEDSSKSEEANNGDANNDADTAGRRRIFDKKRSPVAEDSTERDLMRSYETPELPDTFFFDYAINGKITSLSKEEFLSAKQQLQRVVETLTLLDDPEFTNGQEQDVEVAIRLRGCGRKCVFGLTHVYWA